MDYRFDFDDQLPDLPIAFDFDEVADLFERKLFGPKSAQDLVGVLSIKKLQDLQKPFELMTYPGAKHGLSTPQMKTHVYTAIQRFFDQHLKH